MYALLRILWIAGCLTVALVLPKGDTPDWNCNSDGSQSLVFDVSNLEPTDYLTDFGNPAAPVNQAITVLRGGTVQLSNNGATLSVSASRVDVQARPGWAVTEVSVRQGGGSYDFSSDYGVFGARKTIAIDPGRFPDYVWVCALPSADAEQAIAVRDRFAALAATNPLAYQDLTAPAPDHVPRVWYTLGAIALGLSGIEFVKRLRQPWNDLRFGLLRLERLRRLRHRAW